MTFGQAMGLLIFSSAIGGVAGVWIGVYLTHRMAEMAFLKMVEHDAIFITAVRLNIEAVTKMVREVGESFTEMTDLLKKN